MKNERQREASTRGGTAKDVCPVRPWTAERKKNNSRPIVNYLFLLHGPSFPFNLFSHWGQSLNHPSHLKQSALPWVWLGKWSRLAEAPSTSEQMRGRWLKEKKPHSRRLARIYTLLKVYSGVHKLSNSMSQNRSSKHCFMSHFLLVSEVEHPSLFNRICCCFWEGLFIWISGTFPHHCIASQL